MTCLTNLDLPTQDGQGRYRVHMIGNSGMLENILSRQNQHTTLLILNGNHSNLQVLGRQVPGVCPLIQSM